MSIDYFYSYKGESTAFRILLAGKKFETTCQSWWAGRDDCIVNQYEASNEEENVEEDIFGYTNMLKDNHDAAVNLHSLCSRSAKQ